MKGFEIDINGQKAFYAVHQGVVIISLEKTHVFTTGCDRAIGIGLNWKQSELNVGDKIKIVASEIKEYDAPVKTKLIDRQKLLSEYLDLKETLIKEGILK